jgi:hypothetical protein
MSPKQSNNPNALEQMYAEAHAEAYRSYLRTLKQHLASIDVDALDLSHMPPGIMHWNIACLASGPGQNIACLASSTVTPKTSSSPDKDTGESS